MNEPRFGRGPGYCAPGQAAPGLFSGLRHAGGPKRARFGKCQPGFHFNRCGPTDCVPCPALSAKEPTEAKAARSSFAQAGSGAWGACLGGASAPGAPHCEGGTAAPACVRAASAGCAPGPGGAQPGAAMPLSAPELEEVKKVFAKARRAPCARACGRRSAAAPAPNAHARARAGSSTRATRDSLMPARSQPPPGR